jgi:hypothetical protein
LCSQAAAAARDEDQRRAPDAPLAAAIRETIASRPAPFELAITGRFIESVERTAGEAVWQAWSQAGRALSVEAAVAYALS